MSKPETANASDAYKKRYAEYQRIYCETSMAMTPPPMEPAESADPNNPAAKANIGAQKTVLKRQVRYNKPGMRQSLKPQS